MFLGQPLAARLGTELKRDLNDRQWTQFEIGVAWVRKSGTRHVDHDVRDFLLRGGRLLATVGLDFEHTTVEGLEAMLRWETVGAVEIYVFHDEGASTFHPKVYLFTGTHRARLYIGSNNLTEAGLYNNHEAGLRLDGPTTSAPIADATAALRFWREESDLVKRLDANFLRELEVNGYVLREVDAAKRERAARALKASTKKPRKKLFGSAGRTAPPTPPARGPKPTVSIVGQALLMRVRPGRGGVQLQIPKGLRNSAFLAQATEVVSAANVERHAIGTSSARGNVNTFKFDAPEVAGMVEPLLRMQWVGTDLTYEAFDAASPGGAQIKAQLLAGFRTGASNASKTDLATATWWRFI